MSAENIQLIRKLVEAFNVRDIDSVLQDMQPDVELHPLRAQLERKAYRGHDGVREMLADFDQDWESIQVNAEEFRDADDEVVVLGRLRARGRASGIDLDVPMGFVWTLRDGKVLRIRSFSDQTDALRAAGLE